MHVESSALKIKITIVLSILTRSKPHLKKIVLFGLTLDQEKESDITFTDVLYKGL